MSCELGLWGLKACQLVQITVHTEHIPDCSRAAAQCCKTLQVMTCLIHWHLQHVLHPSADLTVICSACPRDAVRTQTELHQINTCTCCTASKLPRYGLIVCTHYLLWTTFLHDLPTQLLRHVTVAQLMSHQSCCSAAAVCSQLQCCANEAVTVFEASTVTGQAGWHGLQLTSCCCLHQCRIRPDDGRILQKYRQQQQQA